MAWKSAIEQDERVQICKTLGSRSDFVELFNKNLLKSWKFRKDKKLVGVRNGQLCKAVETFCRLLQQCRYTQLSSAALMNFKDALHLSPYPKDLQEAPQDASEIHEQGALTRNSVFHS